MCAFAPGFGCLRPRRCCGSPSVYAAPRRLRLFPESRECWQTSVFLGQPDVSRGYPSDRRTDRGPKRSANRPQRVQRPDSPALREGCREKQVTGPKGPEPPLARPTSSYRRRGREKDRTVSADFLCKENRLFRHRPPLAPESSSLRHPKASTAGISSKAGDRVARANLDRGRLSLGLRNSQILFLAR